jgi:5-methylcytosine-specific restriction protein A
MADDATTTTRSSSASGGRGRLIPLPLRTKQRNWYDPRTYRAGRRTFSNEVKRLAWRRCNRQCQECTRQVTGAGDIEFDHIIAWEISHDSSLGNCQVLCSDCHAAKTAAQDVPAIAAADRKTDFHIGVRGPGKGARPLPAGRNSPISKTLQHGVVPRRSQAQKHRDAIARRYEFRDREDGQ